MRVKCPHCNKVFGKVFEDEWAPECMTTPVNIICEKCDGRFAMQSIPVKIRWDVKKLEKK